MGKFFSFAFVAICFFTFDSCQSQQTEVVQKIDKAALKKKVVGKQVQFVDVRTSREYEDGHIDDAVNIDVNDPKFKDQISKLDKNRPIYLYCKKGGRSKRAANILKELGFRQIYDYSGGYDDWSLIN